MRQLAEIHRAASEANLSFLLIGSWAVCAHGYARLTEDLDLLTQKEHRGEWDALLEKLGYAPRIQPGPFGQWAPPEGAPGFTILDVMFVNESTFVQMKSAAKPATVEGTQTEIPSLEHLFALKFHAIRFGGERRKMKDYVDVTYLMEFNKVDPKAAWFRDICLNTARPKSMKASVEKAELEFPIDPTFDPPKPTMTLDQYADFVRRFGGRVTYDRNKDSERCLVPFELK